MMNMMNCGMNCGMKPLKPPEPRVALDVNGTSASQRCSSSESMSMTFSAGSPMERLEATLYYAYYAS